MSAKVVPGFAMLEGTPRVLQWLTDGLDEADAHWKPAPDRWCVVEVVAHLADIEGRGFRGRVEAMMAEDEPLLPAIDPDQLAREGRYVERPLAPTLAAFREERARSLEYLRSVKPSDLVRRGIHGGIGPITLSHLLHEWPLHDLGHLRQVAELVRARRFHPHIGPWQAQYTLKP